MHPTADPDGPLRPTAPVRSARLLLAAACVLAAVLRLQWFDAGGRSPDEQLYTRFARGLAREGPAWQVRIVHDFNRDGDVDYPWQQRIGFTGLVALAQRATGDTTETAGEKLSVAASLGAIGATGALAWSTLGPWPAVTAVTLLAVSPLDLGLARRAWQDDVVMLVAVLMMWAVVRRADRGSRRAELAFFALAAYGMLVKESLAIPAGLGTLALAGLAWRRTGRVRDALPPLGAGLLALGAALAVVVAVSGGWRELRTTLELAKVANAPDDYMRNYQTGGALDYYAYGLLKLQPLPWALAALAAPWVLLRARAWPDPRARRTLVVSALHAVSFCAVAFAYASKNMRFLSPVYPAVALLAAAALQRAHAWAARRGVGAGRLAAAALVLLVLATAAADVARFRHYFVEDEIQDLATPWFTQADAQDRADRAAERAEADSVQSGAR